MTHLKYKKHALAGSFVLPILGDASVSLFSDTPAQGIHAVTTGSQDMTPVSVRLVEFVLLLLVVCNTGRELVLLPSR